MIAKYWKKIGLIILVIACLYNIVSKIVSKNSFENEVEASIEYVNSQTENQEMNNNT